MTATAFPIALDTYLDRQNGFVIATNPAAHEYDGQFSNEVAALARRGNEPSAERGWRGFSRLFDAFD